MPTALVIDDNFHNRHIFRIALEHAGYGVTESDDGLKGLNALKSASFELVILDLRMPGMDGTDVLRIMRKTEEWQTTQVVVVTANPHMVTDDIRTMADYVLQKPVDILTFSALAQRLYARSLNL
jgi:CheY-like chemotaxis protein